MHGPSFSSFHSLSFSIYLPKLTIFTISRLYISCKMWKITARTWEISSRRVVEKFHIFSFSMYYSLWNWIGEHEITKLKKYIFTLNPEKRTQKQAQKDMNEMEWHKMDYLIFSAMRKRHLFCTSSHHNVLYEKQPELNKVFEARNESLLERVRNY